MLFQPVEVWPDEVNGAGCVDVSENVEVSWQVSGNSAMVAWMVQVYAADAAGTLLYSTGRQSLTEPFWGTDGAGEKVRFGVTLSASELAEAGIANGNEYRLVITQWWSATESVRQNAASCFVARRAPVVALSGFSSVITTRAATFRGTYSQAQGDALGWVRWRIAIDDHREEPFVDTGCLVTGVLECSAEGFLPGGVYAVRLDIETVNRVQTGTGWQSFSVTYPVSEPQSVTAVWQPGDDCVTVAWQTCAARGYDVFRRRIGEEILWRVASVGAGVAGLRDYGVRSGEAYMYYVFPVGVWAYLSSAMVSGSVAVVSGVWSVFEGSLQSDGSYRLEGHHRFRYGDGGVSEGRFSDNLEAGLRKNFTRYPLRQGSRVRYLSGSVSGYLGQVVCSGGSVVYSDGVEDVEELSELGTGNRVLFLRDPKGRFLRIGISGPVSFSVNHRAKERPQTVTLNWVEVGDASRAMVVAEGDTVLPADGIVFTSVRVDTETGCLMWEKFDGYEGSGLELRNGSLLQVVGSGYRAAEMEVLERELVAEI